MVFKAVRSLIRSALILAINEEKVFYADAADQKADIYDYCEVISIGAACLDNEECVEISLKPTISYYYIEDKITHIRDGYESSFACKK